MRDLRLPEEEIQRWIEWFRLLTVLPIEELEAHGVDFIKSRIFHTELDDELKDKWEEFFDPYFKGFWSREEIRSLYNYTSDPEFRNNV